MQKNTNLRSLHSTVDDFIWVAEKEKKENTFGAMPFWWTEPFTNSLAIAENAHGEKGDWFFFFKKIRYQAAMREKEKEARTSYKIAENASREKEGWKTVMVTWLE